MSGRYGLAPPVSHHPGQQNRSLLGSSSSRDPTPSKRYLLTHPEGVNPLSSQKNNNHELTYPDFFPWRKTPAEDNTVLKNVQKGYYQSSVFPNESLSARKPMIDFFNAQKEACISNLSDLISEAMDIRHQSHRFTSSSSFRPPPRVTLTEQKKEAWLRDLANPSVPLRKLSRTIPHGTRNRSLLEQCCSKAIPISRAVWLARCVGANELRGLKRKGAASSSANTLNTPSASTLTPEATWIREWTEQVTEYIEKIIKDHSLNLTQQQAQAPANNSTSNNVASPASMNDISDICSASSSPRVMQNYASPIPPGQSPRPPVVSSTQQQQFSLHQHPIPWKNKLEYILILSEQLYMEDLLDKPIFLKWCISFFDQCKIFELPAALLFLRAFWASILQSSNISQTFALALLHHYAALNGTKSAAPASLVTSSHSLSNSSSLKTINYLSSPALINHPVIVDLRQKLAQYTRTLFIYSPDTFVIPAHWKSLGPILGIILKDNSNVNNTSFGPLQLSNDLSLLPELAELYTFIAARNENLIITDSADIRALRHPKFLIIDALDKAQVPFNWEPISQTISSNKLTNSQALHTAYVWATTNSRTGSERVYTCTSLVSYWVESFNWDVSSAFIDFLLNTVTNTEDFAMTNIYDLITEFLDRDWFCISTYIRRLISSGILFIPRLRQIVQAQILIVTNLPTQFLSENLRNQQIILLNSVGIHCLKDEPMQLQLLSKQLYSILDFLSPDYQIPTFTQDSKSLKNTTSGKEYIEISGEICTQITQLTKGGQLELSMWIFNLFSEKVESTKAALVEAKKSNDEDSMDIDEEIDFGIEPKEEDTMESKESPRQFQETELKPFVPTISQFSLLQNLFEILRDPKSLYCVIEAMIPNVKNTVMLGFLGNCIRDHLLIFSALANISQIIIKLVIQFKSLKTNTKMPKCLWDLAMYAYYNLDCTLSLETSADSESGHNIPCTSFNLKDELEALFKTGPAFDGTDLAMGLGIDAATPTAGFIKGKMNQDITSLSPVSDSVFGKDSSDNLFEENPASKPQLSLNDVFSKPINSASIPQLFSEIVDNFLQACQFEGFVSKLSSSAGSGSDIQMSEEAMYHAKEIRTYAKALMKLRDTDTDTFTSLLIAWVKDICFPESNKLSGNSSILDLSSQQKVEKDTQILTRILLFLITYECLTFEKAVETFLTFKNTPKNVKDGSAALDEGSSNGGLAGNQNQSSLSGPEGLSPKYPSSGVLAQQPNTTPIYVKPLRVILNLVSLKFVDTGIQLKASEKLALNMHRRIFERTHPDLFAKCIVREISEAVGAEDESVSNLQQAPHITHTMLFQHHLQLLHQHENQQAGEKANNSKNSFILSGSGSSADSNQDKSLETIFDETDSSFSTVLSFLLWLSIADIHTFISAFIMPIIQSNNKKVIEVSKSITAHLLKLPSPLRQETQHSKIDLKGSNVSVSNTIREDIMQLASICNDFNIHLCQVHLRITLQILQMSVRQTEDQFMNSAADTVLDLILGRFMKKNQTSKTTTSANTNIPEVSNQQGDRISPRVFGDLMVHLSKKFKAKLLYKAEMIFMTSFYLFYSPENRYEVLTHSVNHEQGYSMDQDEMNDETAKPAFENKPAEFDCAQQEPDAIKYLLEIVDAVSDSVETPLFPNNKMEFISCLEHVVMLTENFQSIEDKKPCQCIIPDGKIVTAITLTNAILLVGKVIMIHSSTIANTQSRVLLLDRIQNGLARLLNTQFVRSRSSFLFGLLFDIFNALRGSATGSALGGTGGEDEALLASQSPRGSVSGPSVQTSTVSSPVSSTFGRNNSPAYWPQQNQQQANSSNKLQKATSNALSGFSLSSNSHNITSNSFNTHIIDSSSPTSRITSQNNGPVNLGNSSVSDPRSTSSLIASALAYQNAMRLSQQRVSIGSGAVSQLSLLREKIIAFMKRDDIAGRGIESESYFTGLVVHDSNTGENTKLASTGARSFDMLEEASHKMGYNDTPISLSMFNTYSEKHNP